MKQQLTEKQKRLIVKLDRETGDKANAKVCEDFLRKADWDYKKAWGLIKVIIDK